MTLLPGLAAMLLIAGCGGTGDGAGGADTAASAASAAETSEAGASAPNAEIDPCALLTDARVSQALGRPVQGEIRIPGAQCSWYANGEDRAAFFVTVKDFRGIESFAERGFGEGDPDLAGLGKRANLEKPRFGSGTTLNVLLDAFVVHIGSSTSDDLAPLKELAPEVITQLESY